MIIFHTISCPLYNLKTVRDISMKLGTLIKHVSEKKIFVCFSYCKYMGANVPWGGAILNPRGIIDRIYVKHHITLPHTK